MTPLLEKARLLTRHGFSIIPTKNKIPVIESWTDRRRKLATDEENVAWFSNCEADSIAIAINYTEFAIDTDGECEQIFLERALPICSEELREKITKTTYTKTPNGYHRTFRISTKDFPEGIPERIYLTLNGEDHKHDEIALKGRNHYLVEYGPGYITINDIECLVTLTKERVDELLYCLEEISPNRDKYRRERVGRPKNQHLDQKQSTNSNAYCLEETEINQIIETLLPLYQQPFRENIAFTCSGYLHKCEISGDSIKKIIHRLASETKDEEYTKRLDAVKDTCTKSRDFVSGRNRFIEVLSLVTNNGDSAEEIVNSIGKIVSQARRNQGGESGFESDEGEDDELRGIDYNILQKLSPHVYNVVCSNPPVMYVAHKGKRKIIRAVVKFVTETTTTTDNSRAKEEEKTQKQLLLWKELLIFAIPTKVIINENRLDGSKTYQITFIGRSKEPFTLGPDSIDSIINELDSKGKVLRKDAAGEGLRAILYKYEDVNLAEINDKIPYPGYYWIEGQVIGYDTTQDLVLDPKHNEEHRKKILECIDVIEELYMRNKNKVAYSTVLKWSPIAPFSYVKKCIDTSDSNWLPYLYPYGWTRTGKNTI